MILELDNVSKVYDAPEGEVRALDGVSLSLAAGEFVVVRGTSGCGKSTLLLAAGGLLRPSRGVVRVAGQELYNLSANARALFRASHIGFVFQQFHLIPYLNVRDNVLAAGLAQRDPGQEERAGELIRQLNLGSRTGHLPGELSTGERQRVALARAFLNRPRVILADEPTGNLDDLNAQAVLDALGGFAAAGGTVLLVTHDARIAGHASRLLRMDSGRLVAE